MIDELFGIQQGSVKLPADKFAGQGGESGGAETRHIALSSAEELYAVIRTLNFNAVGPTLSRKARNISAQFQVHRSLSLFLSLSFVIAEMYNIF